MHHQKRHINKSSKFTIMEKDQNITDNANNKKKKHLGRNAAIIGGAAVLGGAGSAAAALSFLGNDEVLPELEVEEDVEVEYDVEPLDVEQDIPVSYDKDYHNVITPQELDPIVDDVNEVALNVVDDEEEEPFDATTIDEVSADDMPESSDIEFIEIGNDEFEPDVIDVESEYIMVLDDDFEEIDVNFDEDLTIEEIIADDIDDSGFDADIF